MTRTDGRRANELRRLDITPDFLEQAHGSALFVQGKTRVLCTASIEEGVPRWLAGRGTGWMTAEYSLLPASTGQRTAREASTGRQKGRTVEIQRLIGRALRAVTDFEALGERTLWLDCDVLQADGGTRCAAICGAYVAARRALEAFGLSKALRDSVAAVSVGIVGGEARVGPAVGTAATMSGGGVVEYTPATCLVMCIPTPLSRPSAPGFPRSTSVMAAMLCNR